MESTKNPFKNVIISSPSGLNKLLLKIYPNLSLTELKVCALLVLNHSSKDIGEFTGRSIRTIEFTRYSIRKKMNLSTATSLVKHLILLAEEGNDKISMKDTL